MAYADLDRALACCRALRELVIHHPGGWADTGSLAEVRRLCGAVAAAVEDAECKAPLAAIEEHAADLSPRATTASGRSAPLPARTS
jgi:hypothetical protein